MSGGQQDFVAIAIAAQAGEQFVGPCGACRLQFPNHSLLWIPCLRLQSFVCSSDNSWLSSTLTYPSTLWDLTWRFRSVLQPSPTGGGATNLNVDMSANISKDQHAFKKLINGVQYFSTQVTNLNVLLPEAFTPRVGKVISKLFQKPLIWYIYRGWISNSTATEPTELMEPVEPTELCEKMLKF